MWTPSSDPLTKVPLSPSIIVHIFFPANRPLSDTIPLTEKWISEYNSPAFANGKAGTIPSDRINGIIVQNVIVAFFEVNLSYKFSILKIINVC